MRYVNFARTEEERNVVAFQKDFQIFFCACKKILPPEELLVMYGEYYAQDLFLNSSRGQCCIRLYNVHIHVQLIYYIYIYIFFAAVCEICSKLYHGDCPKQPPIISVMNPSINAENSAMGNPIPDCLTISSRMEDGVFATKLEISGTCFGPYEGDVVLKSELSDIRTDTRHMFEVHKYTMYTATQCTCFLL